MIPSADNFGIIFNPGETMKCTTIKFGSYESVEAFELSLTSDDQAAILTNAVIDVTVVPEVVFTRNRLSVEIAIRGLTVATVRCQHSTVHACTYHNMRL